MCICWRDGRLPVGKNLFVCSDDSNFNSYRPNVGGVIGLADLYVDEALGFSLGWAAWVHIL